MNDDEKADVGFVVVFGGEEIEDVVCRKLVILRRLALIDDDIFDR
jgi:hypothetical protein